MIREEQHNNTSHSTELKTEAIGFSVHSTTPTNDSQQTQQSLAAITRFRDPNRTCTHCSRKGHENSGCFLLHGYPDWWYEQQKTNTGGSSQRGGRGGRSSNSSNRGRGRSNSTRLVSNNTTTTPSQSSLSNDQIAQLLQTSRSTNISTESLSGKTKLNDVIIDTGASHHMTGDLALLSDITDIIPSSVKFPDGRMSSATKKGTPVLSRDYFLRDVLYVPDFNCTLISVSRLLKQTCCIAIFTDTLCVLQDRFTKT